MASKKITIDSKLYDEIAKYCELNEIKDISKFINNCIQQAFSVVKFGVTPKDNIRRETLGIKEPEKKETQEIKKEETPVVKRKLRVIKKD